MAHLAITVEGGLISSDLVEQIAATPQDVLGQRPADFGLDGRLSGEIQKAFSEAMIYWNAFNARLARGKESATTITRETWVLPLLEELGFTLAFQRAAVAAGGGSFMLSHRLGADPAAPPVHIVSCEQEVDRRGDAARSPHALVQDYLNRSDTLWGIVTNGMTLRLLRNTVRFSKPSFIEFDLEAIFKGNLYSEFVLFYRLVHATRLPHTAGDAHECWLEKYYQQGIEQGGRVRERLRDGVEEALKILGTGFLVHLESNGLRGKLNGGGLSHLDYYRELLRLIYRLLFLMVAEERRLLFVPNHENAARQNIYDHWYSVEWLRKRAESRFFDDGHSDLWEGLKHTFSLFEEPSRASQLGLTALDGELFGRFACVDLIDRKGEPGPRLSNANLLAAIWHLSTFEDAGGHKHKRGVRRRVNFGGLDVEELGSVYESLLDYHPEVSIGGALSKFDLIVGSERKTTGSYYTPPELVRELIKSALEPVIEERLAKAATRDDKERALLSLKVCDPSSGSGHFMLAAARRLGRELARVRSGETEPNPSDYRRAVRDVIRRCIYTVDKNPLAVDLCKVALWIEGHEPGLPLSFLDHHVKCGESLVGVFDLKALEPGIPNEAYKAVTGDDKKVSAEIRKRNKQETKQDSLFRHTVEQDIAHIGGAFGAIADLPESSPDEVQAKEAAYGALRRSDEWEKAKWACDLWTAGFFTPLTKESAGAVPTTRDVWDVIGGRAPQGRVAGASINLATAQRFFHWPLEFPEVFAAGGFDVMLGNPPWERIKLQEKEFFEARDREIAQAPNKSARAQLIKALFARDAAEHKRTLAQEWEEAKHASDCEGKFVRYSGRYPFTATGDINTYAIFAETFLRSIRGTGRSGFIVPTGIATDDTTKTFFEFLSTKGHLICLYDFQTGGGFFDEIGHARFKFCLLTISADGDPKRDTEYSFFSRNISDFSEPNRHFTLLPDEIAKLNPNTKTAPIFRSQADAALTKKIYGSNPILIDDSKGDVGNSWGITFMRMFDMSEDSGLFRTGFELEEAGAKYCEGTWLTGDGVNYVPLYEAKMVHQFDHRWGTFASFNARPSGSISLPRPKPGELEKTTYEPQPWYWISLNQVNSRLTDARWPYDWLIGWRDITNAGNERTLISTVIPKCGCNDKFLLLLPRVGPRKCVALLGCLNSLALDYVARQKLGGMSLKYFVIKQLPVLPPSTFSDINLDFIVPRVCELTYTSETLRPFAKDLGYDRAPFQWNAERRAILRAELDAYYAYLYGLTRRELEYILDPKAVMGEDYPSETFRVLKENEEDDPSINEYRTKRLVLEAWNRFVADGTFDPTRLREPQYIDRVAEELAAMRAKLEQVELDSKALLALAKATPKPTLFVEGATDAKIIEAAWAVFFPSEQMPVKVIAAGGTKEMGSLAGKGKALREILGEQAVLVLADNDAAGRALVDDGHTRKGGMWRRLPSGIHWCLLKPTASFTAAMDTHKIPVDYRPFTIEAAFPPTLRRQAEAADAWRFSGSPQAELLDNPDLARRLFALVPKLSQDDNAYWYLMAPAPEAKEAFAGWVTDPKRRTEENYAAFEEIIRGLRAILVRSDNSEATPRARGAA
jgi:hypothetical protein